MSQQLYTNKPKKNNVSACTKIKKYALFSTKLRKPIKKALKTPFIQKSEIVFFYFLHLINRTSSVSI